MRLGEVCEHGQLARSCETCDYEAEIAELKEDRDGYRNGQMQAQHILSATMDSNARYAREVELLKQQIYDLHRNNQFYLQYLHLLTADNNALRKQMTRMCDECHAMDAVLAIENIAHACPCLPECDDCLAHIKTHQKERMPYA